MGLLGVPAALSGPPYAKATTSSAKRILQATCVEGNTLFAGTGSSSQGLCYRWKDITSPGGYDQFSQTDLFINDIMGVVASGPYVYFVANNFNVNVNQLTAIRVPADTFASSPEVIAQSSYGAANSQTVTSTLAGVASDGTYLYLLSSHTGENAWLVQWQLSNGSQLQNTELPNPSSGSARLGTQLVLDLPTATLFGAGGGFTTGGTWAMTCPTSSFASPTMLHLAIFLGIAPGAFVDANYFWVPASSATTITRINRDFSANTVVTMPTGSINAISADPGGQYIWIAHGGSNVSVVDKAANLIAGPISTGLTLVDTIYGIWPLGAIVTTGPASPTNNSSIAFVPFWPDLSQTATLIAGRGATR